MIDNAVKFEFNPGERRINGRLMCMAHDCPCIAAVNMGGGWLCGYHADRPADRWRDITNRLLSPQSVDARTSVAHLRMAINEHRTNDYPTLMRRVQDAIMQAGGTSEDVKLRPQADHLGNEFPEPPEHFANRMSACLLRLFSPEDERKPSAPARGETRSIDALAAIVEAEAA